MLNVLRGLVLNPLLVAFARGAVEAAVMAALLYAGDATVLEGVVPEEMKMWVPLIVLALRQLEGVADKIDPDKQRRRDVIRAAEGDGGA